MAKFGISRTNDDRDFIPSDLDAQYTTCIQKTKYQGKNEAYGVFWLIFAKLLFFVHQHADMMEISH